MRTPEMVVALNRLRDLLAASPAATGQKHVIEILRRASREVNPEWTVPQLDDPAGMNKVFADGSVRITLVAHHVLINPSGAYRILESHPPQERFIERRSASGDPFIDPPEYPPKSV